MRRFFVRPEHVGQQKLRLIGAEAVHLGRVLRLGPGAQIQAFDGVGHEYIAVVEQLAADGALCRILQSVTVQSMAAVQISLGQGFPKGDKFEWVVQKTTELGVSDIVPLVTDRAVPQLSGRNVSIKHRRWQKIAREACKQCGRSTVPCVQPPQQLDEFFAAFQTADLKLLLWEGSGVQRLRAILGTCEHPGAIAVVIGPEGGFTRQEVARGESYGFLPVGLGERILRTETASIVTVALLQHRFGDLG